MRRITQCAELTEWPYKWKQKKRKKKKLSQAIKSTAPFYHQRLNGSGEQQSIITASPCAPAKPDSLHCQKTRCCCCWQIDLQANAEILFFKRSLSVFIGAAGALHGNQVWGNYFSYQTGLRSFLSPPFWSHYFSCFVFFCLFFLSDASAQSVWLPRGTLGHPPEKINIWTMLLWGQHVRVYKIKWGLKLISSSPWKSLQVLGNETTRRRSAAEGRWPPPRQIHNCFCFSKLNEPFYYYYYFYIAEPGVRNCQLWHVRF